MRLSVLDLVPVRADQHTSDALTATRRLAKAADELGYNRYWVAEHHNLPGVAATNPPLLIAYLAAHTSRLRLGAGGVILPNHAPLVVAEQFTLLEAAYPGRIDLGIGRSPVWHPVISPALRCRDATDLDDFRNSLDEVRALIRPCGMRIAVPGRDQRQEYLLKATPAATSQPCLWLLGSSMYSAHLAAAKGLPYVFAHHLCAESTRAALETYRREFVPSDLASEPMTFLTVNAAVAHTRDEAMALILPNLRMKARQQIRQPLGPLPLVEDAQNVPLTPQEHVIIDAEMTHAVVGTPAEAANQIRAIAEKFVVGEVMINPIASARRGTDPTAAPAREMTLELLARELSGAA